MLRVGFRDNLLAQFSVVTFVIMVILALVVTIVLIEILNNNLELIRERDVAVAAGEAIDPSEPISIESLSSQVNNLKWITIASIGGSFIYLYATLVYLVWEGWRTIVKQRVELEEANAELEKRVAERVEQLREAMGEGQRRLDAFQTAAGRLALEEVPEKALQDLVDVSRDLVGASYGVLALLDSRGATGKFVTSGFSDEQRGGASEAPTKIEDLGLTASDDDRIVVEDGSRLLSAHGISQDNGGIESFLGVPVTLSGSSSGVFYLINKIGEEKFSPDDHSLVNLFAVLAGVHLENLNLYEEVALERRTLAAIQSSMTEGLVVVDPSGGVLYLNETAEALWGFNPKDVEGKRLRDVLGGNEGNFESPEDMQKLLSIMNGHGDGASTVELTVSKPQRRHLLVTSFPIPAAGRGSMTGLLARDVTRERELAERRNAFISIASHELRTPMTAIMGFSELLLNDRNLPESSQVDWLKRINQNSQILSAIVDDMLDVSRIQSGRLALTLEHVDAGELIDEILVGIKGQTDEHEFVVDVPSDAPQVVADREKLSQIIMNLLTNATKYSPAGGQITVAVRPESEGERVVFSVSDEGIGIAPEDLEQLFTSFHRISRKETESIRGTGLGLSIVRGLANLMRGEAWVESELDKGSSFFFSVPTKRTDIDVTDEAATLSAT